MAKDEINPIVAALTVVFVLACFFGAFAFMLGWTWNESENNACDKLNDYGYKAEVEGNFWDVTCYVYMEDGTKIHNEDFNIADFKKPIER